MEKVLDDMGLGTGAKTNKLEQLFKKVKRLRNTEPTAVATRKPNQILQADLLFMPNDNGFKYILTVADTNNNAVDAQPLKSKEAAGIIDGLKKIFARKFVKKPGYSIESDPGSEFNNKKLVKYLNDNNILLRVGAKGRSNQQSIVEFYNGILALILFKIMTVNELENGEEDKAWADNLPKLIVSLNKNFKSNKAAIINRDVMEESNEEVLPIGTKVRTATDKPVSILDGNRLTGNHRATDVRWTIKAHEIEDYSLRPNQPILYKVKDMNHNYFTRNQLQVIDEKEALPSKSKFIVNKILSKLKKKGKVFYRVLWEDGSKTEEPRANLIKDIPDMIKEFDKKKN